MLITILAQRSPSTSLRRLTSTFSTKYIHHRVLGHTRSMSNSAFEAKPFRLSLVQLGGTGSDKAANLAHAKEMVLKAAQSVGGKKTDIIVLPVSALSNNRIICGLTASLLGMLQFSIWACSFSQLCRAYWL